MSQFEKILNINPDKDATGFHTGILVKAPKPKNEGSIGGAGGELPVYLFDEEESIAGDKLNWLLALLQKSTSDSQRREAAGHFSISQNAHVVFAELGQKDSYRIPNNIVADSLYIGHTHANVSANQLFPSQADLNFSTNNALPNYIISSTNIVKIDSTGRISGIYNIDGNKTELKSFFQNNQIVITEVSEPTLQSFTKPSNIEAANPAPSLQIEGGFLEGEGSGEGSQDVYYLLDDMNNPHPLSRVNFVWQNFTADDGEKRLPKFYEKNAKGEFIKEGATLLITFLNKDFLRPVVMGCLEAFGGQNRYSSNMNSDLDFMHREENSNINDDFEIRRTISDAGSVDVAVKAKTNQHVTYRVSFEGAAGKAKMIYDTNGDFIFSSGKNSIQLIDDKIYIGAGDYKDKAKEVGINAERIILGNSTFLKPTISNTDKLMIDKGSNNQEITSSSSITVFNNTQMNQAKHQWGVMGHTLIWIMMELIDIWGTTKYQSGNTICLVSEEDKSKMKNRVRDLLPKILSNVVSLIKNPEN